MSGSIKDLCLEIGGLKVRLDLLQAKRDEISKEMDSVAKELEALRMAVALTTEEAIDKTAEAA